MAAMINSNSSTPVVKIKYQGAVYEDSIQLNTDIDKTFLLEKAKLLANLKSDTPITLIRTNYGGKLVQSTSELEDGEILEICESQPDNCK
jgi:hypothetical protein